MITMDKISNIENRVNELIIQKIIIEEIKQNIVNGGQDQTKVNEDKEIIQISDGNDSNPKKKKNKRRIMKMEKFQVLLNHLDQTI